MRRFLVRRWVRAAAAGMLLPLAAVAPAGSATISSGPPTADLGTPLPQAIAAPRASQRNTPATSAEPAFIASPEAAALRARGHVFTPVADIGAATAIEFLDGRVLAAAEPVRRGGGSAAVERPGG